MRLLFVGDVVAEPGLRAVRLHLPDIRDRYDLVIANGENTTGGKGLCRKHYRQLRAAGVDAVTLGNHAWDHKEIYDLIETEPILRAANYPPGTPGRDHLVLEAAGKRLLLFQLMGRVFLEPNLDSPFRVADRLLATVEADHTLVEVHAEATSEKYALFHHLDGRVAAVLGTHTHVPTADGRISRRGTGYLTDVGMTGTYDSIIGGEVGTFLQRFLTARPQPFRSAKGPAELWGVELELAGGRAVRLSPYRWQEP